MANDINMEEIREFFNPHPGTLGTIEPLPQAFKEVVDALVGQRISLAEASSLLDVVIQKIGGEICFEKSLIYLFYPHRPSNHTASTCKSYYHHCWRLIEYRPP